jgi:hypothetical protein
MDLRGSESKTKFLLLAGHKNLGKSDTGAVSYQKPPGKGVLALDQTARANVCESRPRITQILTAQPSGIKQNENCWNGCHFGCRDGR